MESSHTSDLDIPELKAAASKAHVFPGMAHHSLLSVGQLCNEGYIFTFRQDTVIICNSESPKLLSGPRDETTGIWQINLKQTNKHTPDPIANNVYELRNAGTLIHYLHKALFSPTKSAMLQAVKDGHLITCLWITTKQLLLRQDTKSSHTRNQESGELGLFTGSMGTHLVPSCIITGVKMYTSRQRPANASWTLSNSFPTIIKCHSYHPPTGY
jgi:hypothetical protein